MSTCSMSMQLKVSPHTIKKIMSPHGALSIRKLVSIKIVDKCSCYVRGLHEEALGQFGEISSIRIIQNKNPLEAYIRFTNERSAQSAISWCNSINKKIKSRNSNERLVTAKHGYQKYCMKFINNKKCKKHNCPNKHNWCTSDDIIIIKNKQYKAFQDDIPLALAPNNIKINKINNNSDDEKDHFRSTEEMTILQSQFNVLQSQYSQQNHFIQTLLYQLQQLRTRNQTLKQQNCEINRQLQDKNTEMLQNNILYYENLDESEMQSIVDSVIRDDYERGHFSASSSSSSSSKY